MRGKSRSKEAVFTVHVQVHTRDTHAGVTSMELNYTRLEAIQFRFRPRYYTRVLFYVKGNLLICDNQEALNGNNGDRFSSTHLTEYLMLQCWIKKKNIYVYISTNHF